MGTYTKLSYHVVFSTKYRRRTISCEFEERLYEYIGGTIRNLKGSLIEIGGLEDHLHLLVNLTPAKSVSDSIRDIKANASHAAASSDSVRSRTPVRTRAPWLSVPSPLRGWGRR